jgi:uncharacterized membrane protein (UPF0136 family)
MCELRLLSIEMGSPFSWYSYLQSYSRRNIFNLQALQALTVLRSLNVALAATRKPGLMLLAVLSVFPAHIIPALFLVLIMPYLLIAASSGL